MDSVHKGLVAGAQENHRGFRRIVLFLVWLVIVPTALLLVVGILMLVFWQAQLNLVFGILVVTLVGCLVTGTVLSLVFLRKEANLSKLQTDFVSKVSHELRTPLTSIQMFAEMLQQGKQSQQEVVVCLQALRTETARLSGRIERLLDWGKMESGRKIYQLQPERVEDIVSEALKAFNTANIGRTEEVKVTYNGPLPRVRADLPALSDALLNLLSNAKKYSKDRPMIELDVSADAKHVRIAVRDQGIGIPRAEHRRIFQRFYRVDERLSRAVEGSGLGLAIVRHIVQGHGGNIDVESEIGQGSTFTIVLPVLDSSNVTDDA